jgi:T5orf172 domain
MIKKYSNANAERTIRKVAQAWQVTVTDRESMQPQSPAGWVYFIRSGALIKVGYTTDLSKRMRSYNSHNPDVQLMAVVPGTRDDEAAYHKRFAAQKVRGEWFRLSGSLATMLHGLMEPSTPLPTSVSTSFHETAMP